MGNTVGSNGETWDQVKDRLASSPKRLELGAHWSFNILNDPKRLAFVLSRYKFAAKMVAKGKTVLELGCSEGIGASVLAEQAAAYTGVDFDALAIETARLNFSGPHAQFICDDFLGKRFGSFDSIVSIDVLEHIDKQNEPLFWNTLHLNLDQDGTVLVGTPNLCAEAYASEPSRRGHVNLFDAQRLRAALESLFYNVFIFGMNDEIIHTGFAPMAHFLIGLACYKKKVIGT